MKLVIDFILVTGAVANCFVLFRLYKKAKSLLPFLLLFLIFTLTLIIIINFYSDLHQLTKLYAFTFIFEDGSRFLISVLIFLYIKSLFNNREGFMVRHWLHMVPFLLYTLFFSIPLFLIQLSESFNFPHLEVLKGTYNFTLGKDIFFVTYLIFSLRLFWQFREKMKSNYSTFTEENFEWVLKFLYGALVIISIDTLTTASEYLFWNSPFDTGYITTLALVFMLGYLIYYGMEQSTVFLPDFLKDYGSKSKKKVDREQNSILAEIEIASLTATLEKVMERRKPYLNEDLTLALLAEEIGTTDKKLSALLNQQLNVTFYDLINSFRVEEVKRKLSMDDYAKYSLLGIAHLSGFKSKSSFYRAFKKATGISPTEFKKKITC